ncbi:MAG: sugar ABC transporter substrate-binding protein [Bacillota bacterium]
MKKTKVFSLIAVLALALMLSASILAAPAKKVIKIGVVHNNADHPSITAIVKGMKDEAKYLPVKLTFLDPAFDPQKQASMIEDLIAQRVDVICINAVDPAAVVPGIKKAVKAGIPVVMHNANTNEEGQKYIKTFVSCRSYDQGVAIGEMVVNDLKGKGKVVIISGKPGQTDVVNRTAGFKEAIKGSNIEIIAEQPAEWMKDKAVTVMEDLLTRYSEIDAVFALDDPMALGAIQAIKAAGRLNKIEVYGVNGQKEAIEAIKKGEMAGTAWNFSYLVGVYTLRAAYDVALGRIVDKTIAVPTGGINSSNVKASEKFAW